MIEIKNKNNDVIYAVDSDCLRKANLREADLSEANLREADLRAADLSWANLSEANLSRANLSGADLRWANLSEANLRRANLSRADLRAADLRRANLSWADLSGADLRAKQYVCQIHGSRHPVLAIDDDVRIGCKRQTLAKWLETFESVGAIEAYLPAEIAEYGIYLRTIAAVLEARSPEAGS